MKQLALTILFVMFILIFMPMLSLADIVHQGTVIYIQDGDSFKARINGQQILISISGVDAPEMSQPFGAQSKQALGRLLFGKVVTLYFVANAMALVKNEPIKAKVTLGQRDIAAELVRGGYAWVDRQTTNDPLLIQLEAQARTKRLGLWQSIVRQPPWEWRSRHQ